MTHDLTDVLHQRAAAETFQRPDLDAILAVGDRRVRRRRLGATAGVAALAVALGAGLATLPTAEDDVAPAPADPFPTTTRAFEPVATVGPRVFVGDRMIRVAGWVDDLERTQAGFVYRSDDVLRSYVDGTESVVGTTTGSLVGDEDGFLVAWTDEARGQVVVLDQRTGGTRRLDVPDSVGTGAGVEAVDGGTVYVTGSDGSARVDVASGDSGDLGDVDLLDVENGVLAAWNETGTVLGPVGDSSSRVEIDAGDRGTLSPDGRWYAAADVFEPSQEYLGVGVVDTTTGGEVRLDVEAEQRDLVDATGWVDADTVTVAVVPWNEHRAGGRPEQLFSCDVPSGACTLVIADHGALPGNRETGKTYPGGGWD
ncbi:hypothetical protein [Nocardioides dongxiaopingii]|uniref:hypothetical protein n=1 Tax=Nocardioides dongxiaopingii TaxID=2576036 RepID=UPI0010C7654E|nr:hypothetical protein [Nocardioides dongxiaopingii]